MAYQHGVAAQLAPSQPIPSPTGVGTIPVYVGTAPGRAEDPIINQPVLVSSLAQAKALLGYDEDWGKFTLCEAMAAHFDNPQGNVGPVVMINVFDPEKHAGEDAVPVAAADIIGSTDAEGNRTGLNALAMVYPDLGVVPSLLLAPGFSYIKEVYTAMVQVAAKVNGHWDVQVLADMDSSVVKTIPAALAWKTTNALSARTAKIFWPKVAAGDKTYCLSTLCAWRMQLTDLSNGNVPFESPSNLPIHAAGLVTADGKPVRFDEQQANTLNAKGITTAIFNGGQWVLWGPHNANYEYVEGAAVDPRDVFDAGIRMLMWLGNGFQLRNLPRVDRPLTRSMATTIVNDEQSRLDGLVSAGRLLYGVIRFEETSNPTHDIVQGNFVFDFATTTVPVGKSLTAIISYTTEGLASIFGEGAGA